MLPDVTSSFLDCFSFSLFIQAGNVISGQLSIFFFLQEFLLSVFYSDSYTVAIFIYYILLKDIIVFVLVVKKYFLSYFTNSLILQSGNKYIFILSSEIN